jgi:hypothetical protein
MRHVQNKVRIGIIAKGIMKIAKSDNFKESGYLQCVCFKVFYVLRYFYRCTFTLWNSSYEIAPLTSLHIWKANNVIEIQIVPNA